MSRRSRSTSHPKNTILIYTLIGMVLICAIIAGKITLNQRAQHFSDLDELPINDYKKNANSMSGNQYRISGKIIEKLKWTPNHGQVISVATTEPDKDSGIIAIMIPSQIDQINLERGHRYSFKVEINRAGLPIALDCKAR